MFPNNAKTQTRNDTGALAIETLSKCILCLVNLHAYPREPKGEKLEYCSTKEFGTLVLRIWRLGGLSINVIARRPEGDMTNLGQSTGALAITGYVHNYTPGQKVYEVNFKESGAFPGLATSSPAPQLPPPNDNKYEFTPIPSLRPSCGHPELDQVKVEKQPTTAGSQTGCVASRSHPSCHLCLRRPLQR